MDIVQSSDNYCSTLLNWNEGVSYQCINATDIKKNNLGCSTFRKVSLFGQDPLPPRSLLRKEKTYIPGKRNCIPHQIEFLESHYLTSRGNDGWHLLWIVAHLALDFFLLLAISPLLPLFGKKSTKRYFCKSCHMKHGSPPFWNFIHKIWFCVKSHLDRSKLICDLDHLRSEWI